jgi:hypothetical protein
MAIGSILQTLGKVAKNPYLPAVAGGIAGAIGGTQGGRTATQMPTVARGYETFGDLLKNRIQQRLMTGADMGGYEATGLQNINEAFGGAQQALDASLTSRGLGTSPVAGAAEGKLQQARGGEMARFLNTLPLLQREMQAQDIGMAQNQFQQAGLGQSATQPGGVLSGAFDNVASHLGYLNTLKNAGMLGGGAGAGGGGLAGLDAIAGGIAPAFGAAASTALPAVPAASLPGIGTIFSGFGGSAAAGGAGAGGAAAAGGVQGALGLGGGAGLFGLGAATIPVIGGIAAGAILATKLIGRGRKAADVLTRDGGMQKEFEGVLAQIDSDPSLSAAQKKSAKFLEYQSLVRLGLEHARQGSQQQRVVRQMFNTISPLFGQPNPLG